MIKMDDVNRVTFHDIMVASLNNIPWEKYDDQVDFTKMLTLFEDYVSAEDKSHCLAGLMTMLGLTSSESDVFLTGFSVGVNYFQREVINTLKCKLSQERDKRIKEYSDMVKDCQIMRTSDNKIFNSVEEFSEETGMSYDEALEMVAAYVDSAFVYNKVGYAVKKVNKNA